MPAILARAGSSNASFMPHLTAVVSDIDPLLPPPTIQAVDEDSGRVRVGDSEWTARGGPAEPGDRVRITGVDGNCLIVEVDRRLSQKS